MIKGAYIFYEVIIKSQILSNKFIFKKIREVLPYNFPSKILCAISTKPIDMTLSIKQTNTSFTAFFPCGLILQKSSKFRIPLKSAGKYF